MPIDASIPLSAKAPDPMSSLKDIMGVAYTAQQLKSAKIGTERQDVALSQEKGTLDARNKVAAVVNDPQYHDPATGLFDLNRAAPAIVAADPQNYVAADVISKMAGANNDLLTVKKASLGLADQSRALLGSTVGSLATKPDLSKADISSSLDQLRSQAPDAAPIIDVWEKGLKALPDSPQALQQVVMRARSQVMPPATQQAAQTPSGVPVDNGQGSMVVNTNPGAGPALPVGAPIPGTSVQKQLPPTTPAFDQGTNTPGYVGTTGPVPGGAPGAQAAGGGLSTPPGAPPSGASQDVRDQYRVRILMDERKREENNPDPVARAANLQAIDTEIRGMSKPGAPARTFVASGPKLGTEANVAGTVDAVNKDWGATVEAARTAPQDIGVLQNIKQYARGAAMGVASDRRAYLQGWAGLLGFSDTAQMEKTATDLLAKNTNMLALAGGDTNLAKTLASTINPNVHMTPEAAEHAANQVIAQRKFMVLKQQYMGHFKADPQQYSDALADFNKNTDPRILQLPDMTREEKARMKAAMTPSEQREFGAKIRKMTAMGLVPQ